MQVDADLYAGGVRFGCTGCGECCKSRGRYSYVYLTLAERRRLARHLRLPTGTFTRRYCRRTDGHWHLRDPQKDCLFLDGARCTVYAARPQQCRTWPFWPENMKPKVWKLEVVPGCEGIGRGRRYSEREIERTIVAEARREAQRR